MAANAESIFRKSALERLSSPDQLDRLITLTSPQGWLALAALVALLAGIVTWSFVAQVPTRVSGAGILVARGGQVFDAMSATAGTLSWVVPIGSNVEKGALVATLDGTQAEQELQHARKVLAEQEENLAQLIGRYDRQIAALEKVNAQQRENLNGIIAAAEQRYIFYSQALLVEEPASQKGFLTQRFVQTTRQSSESAAQEMRRARYDLLRVDADELDLRARRDQEVFRQQESVNAARRTVEEASMRLDHATRVVSAIAGRVTEVKASTGTVVTRARPTVSIETQGDGLEMIEYISPDQGKRIAPGMEVRIEPATVKKQEFGTLIGRVTEVSQFPVSPDGMMAILQNKELVTRFTANGAPYAARVELTRDPSSVSGYKWTTGSGPPITISSGTTALAEVTVRAQTPITLVLPLLRGKTGINE